MSSQTAAIIGCVILAIAAITMILLFILMIRNNKVAVLMQVSCALIYAWTIKQIDEHNLDFDWSKDWYTELLKDYDTVLWSFSVDSVAGCFKDKKKFIEIRDSLTMEEVYDVLENKGGIFNV